LPRIDSISTVVTWLPLIPRCPGQSVFRAAGTAKHAGASEIK
jgi:hypothetical protein